MSTAQLPTSPAGTLIPRMTASLTLREIAQILPFFILMFASNAVVPVAVMPGWLQPFARNQPLSVTVSAVRALFEGGPAAQYVWQTVAWCCGMLAVFLPLSLRLYRRT